MSLSVAMVEQMQAKRSSFTLCGLIPQINSKLIKMYHVIQTERQRSREEGAEKDRDTVRETDTQRKKEKKERRKERKEKEGMREGEKEKINRDGWCLMLAWQPCPLVESEYR